MSEGNQSMLQKIDIFGVDIGLVYQNNRRFTSKIGGCITMLIIGALSILSLQLIISLKQRENPNIIYQQSQVNNPSRYNIYKNKFSFMITILKGGLTPYIDESYYTITGIFEMKKEIQQHDGTIKQDYQTKKLIFAPCREEDFQLYQVRDYFLGISFKDCYCIQNQDELFLQGQWEKEQFNAVKFYLNECSNSPTCKDPVERKKFLQTAKVQVYFTDRIIQLQKFKDPFIEKGRTLFYNVIYEFQTDVGLLFQNKHIVDDFGLFMQDEKVTTDLVFSNDRVQFSSKKNESFFQLTLYLEKDREDFYYRTYMKIPSMISQLGGTFNVLLLIGSIIARPYNKLQLLRNLFHDIFSIEQKNKLNKAYKQMKNQNQNQSSQRVIEKTDIVGQKSFKAQLLYFIYSQIRCFKCYTNAILKIVFKGQLKLKKYTSINYLINKLIEFEQVKIQLQQTIEIQQQELNTKNSFEGQEKEQPLERTRISSISSKLNKWKLQEKAKISISSQLGSARKSISKSQQKIIKQVQQEINNDIENQVKKEIEIQKLQLQDQHLSQEENNKIEESEININQIDKEVIKFDIKKNLNFQYSKRICSQSCIDSPKFQYDYSLQLISSPKNSFHQLQKIEQN